MPTKRSAAVYPDAAAPQQDDEDSTHSQIMLSYRIKDTGAKEMGGDDAVLKIKHYLQLKGYTVFVGETSLQGGQLWSERIQAAVTNCDVFIALCSPGYGKSEWTKREFQLADNERKRILPIWHRGSWPPAKLKIFLSGMQRVPQGNKPMVECDFEETMQQTLACLKRWNCEPKLPSGGASLLPPADKRASSNDAPESGHAASKPRKSSKSKQQQQQHALPPLAPMPPMPMVPIPAPQLQWAPQQPWTQQMQILQWPPPQQPQQTGAGQVVQPAVPAAMVTATASTTGGSMATGLPMAQVWQTSSGDANIVVISQQPEPMASFSSAATPPPTFSKKLPPPLQHRSISAESVLEEAAEEPPQQLAMPPPSSGVSCCKKVTIAVVVAILGIIIIAIVASTATG